MRTSWRALPIHGGALLLRGSSLIAFIKRLDSKVLRFVNSSPLTACLPPHNLLQRSSLVLFSKTTFMAFFMKSLERHSSLFLFCVYFPRACSLIPMLSLALVFSFSVLLFHHPFNGSNLFPSLSFPKFRKNIFVQEGHIFLEEAFLR